MLKTKSGSLKSAQTTMVGAKQILDRLVTAQQRWQQRVATLQQEAAEPVAIEALLEAEPVNSPIYQQLDEAERQLREVESGIERQKVVVRDVEKEFYAAKFDHDRETCRKLETRLVEELQKLAPLAKQLTEAGNWGLGSSSVRLFKYSSDKLSSTLIREIVRLENAKSK